MKNIPITVFGVEFQSIGKLWIALDMVPRSLKTILPRHGSIENYLRFKLYPLTDDMIAARLKLNKQKLAHRCANEDIAKVMELVKYGLKYQLNRPDLPRDRVYMIAKELYESDNFNDALRAMLKSRASTKLKAIRQVQQYNREHIR